MQLGTKDSATIEERVGNEIKELESVKRPELDGIYNEHLEAKIQLLRHFPRDPYLIEMERNEIVEALYDSNRKETGDSAFSERMKLGERLSSLNMLESLIRQGLAPRTTGSQGYGDSNVVDASDERRP